MILCAQLYKLIYWTKTLYFSSLKPFRRAFFLLLFLSLSPYQISNSMHLFTYLPSFIILPTLLTASLPERTWTFTRMLQNAAPNMAWSVWKGIVRLCSPVSNSTRTFCSPMLMKVVMYLKSNTMLSVSLDTTTTLSHPLFTLQSMWETSLQSASSCQLERIGTSVIDPIPFCTCSLITSSFTNITQRRMLLRSRRAIFLANSCMFSWEIGEQLFQVQQRKICLEDCEAVLYYLKS